MDGPARVVGEVAHTGARECTHPWNPAPIQDCPEEQWQYLCDPQSPLL
jgi:hypothetical protein